MLKIANVVDCNHRRDGTSDGRCVLNVDEGRAVVPEALA
jgi:hypothetical protein